MLGSHDIHACTKVRSAFIIFYGCSYSRYWTGLIGACNEGSWGGMSFSIEKSFSRKLRSSVQCRECENGVLDGNTWEFPKGLGHAMLGNFSTDQMVIELTEIYHNNGAKNCRRSQTKYKKAKKGHWWTKPERVKMDCTWPGFFASLHSWKIILICYTVVTLQITAYYTFRTHN